MSAVEDRGGTAGQAAGSPARPRRWRPWLLLGVAATVAAGLGWYGWRWYTTPVPPAIAWEEAEPAVARVLKEADNAVRRPPRSGAAWGRLGKVLLANGYGPQAYTCHVQAERLDPANPAWPYLQSLRLLVHDREAALPPLRRAIALWETAGGAGNPAARLRLAEEALKDGDRKEVESNCRLVLKRDPENPWAHFLLGVLAFEDNDLKASLDHLTRAARSPRTRRRAYSQLAAVYGRLQDQASAAQFTRRLRDLPPDQPPPDPITEELSRLARTRQSQFRQAEDLGQAGRFGEQATLLRDLATEFPDADAHEALGIALANASDFRTAEELLRNTARQEPDKVRTHYFLSLVQFQQGEQMRHEPGQKSAAAEKFRQAVASARRALKLQENHGLAYRALGVSLLGLGERAEGIACLRRAIQCRPERADFHMNLGEALAEDGQRDAALKVLQQAVELAPPGDSRPRKALERVRTLEGPRP